MSVEEAKAIYRKRYWDVQRCDELPAGVDYCVFDYGVNSGIGRSGKVLRRVVGLPDNTSVVTDQVLAYARVRDPKVLVAAICDERLAFLKSLRTWPIFGRGWGTRVAEVRAVSLAHGRRSAGRHAESRRLLRGRGNAAMARAHERDPRPLRVPGRADNPAIIGMAEGVRRQHRPDLSARRHALVRARRSTTSGRVWLARQRQPVGARFRALRHGSPERRCGRRHRDEERATAAGTCSSSSVGPAMVGWSAAAATRGHGLRRGVRPIGHHRLHLAEGLPAAASHGAFDWLPIVEPAPRAKRDVALPSPTRLELPAKGVVPPPKVVKDVITKGVPAGGAAGGLGYWDWVAAHPWETAGIALVGTGVVGGAVYALNRWHQRAPEARNPEPRRRSQLNQRRNVMLTFVFVTATLVAIYWFWIRPILKSRPGFSELYEREESLLAALREKFEGIKQKLSSVDRHRRERGGERLRLPGANRQRCRRNLDRCPAFHRGHGRSFSSVTRRSSSSCATLLTSGTRRSRAETPSGPGGLTPCGLGLRASSAGRSSTA